MIYFKKARVKCLIYYFFSHKQATYIYIYIYIYLEFSFYFIFLLENLITTIIRTIYIRNEISSFASNRKFKRIDLMID
jgi:hypothetical protein